MDVAVAVALGSDPVGLRIFSTFILTNVDDILFDMMMMIVCLDNETLHLFSCVHTELVMAAAANV